jgi:hypothetical protein
MKTVARLLPFLGSALCEGRLVRAFCNSDLIHHYIAHAFQARKLLASSCGAVSPTALQPMTSGP